MQWITDFNIPIVLDTTQMLFIFMAFALFGFILLITVILSKGYQLNTTTIEFNLAGASTGIVLLGMSLGIFVLSMVMTPGYVTIPLGSEMKDMFLTMFVIGFITSMIVVTFMLYVKRGGY